MRVLLIEPYYGGSHRAWADGYQQHAQHQVDLLTLPAQFWKWRMQGGAIALARMFKSLTTTYSVLLVSDMVNLATFKALIGDQHTLALYFHESQLTYPQNSRQKHGWRYAFINYISALVADHVYFNSPYHREVFFKTLPNMLKHFGDYNELETIDTIYQKASVLSLGLNLRRFDEHRPKTNDKSPDQPPLIVWNHRWEAEKNPQTFFNALYKLAEAGIAFRVAVTGENVRQEPKEFLKAHKRLGKHIVQFGYLDSFADYARLLWQADYVISTAYQEFFGGAIAEAIYCGCTPLLPRRLNYPNLIPPGARETCLYPGTALYPLLRRHLQREITVQTDNLQAYVRQFDWSNMAPQYDATLAALANLANRP